jgi:hypothetical protein
MNLRRFMGDGSERDSGEVIRGARAATSNNRKTFADSLLLVQSNRGYPFYGLGQQRPDLDLVQCHFAIPDKEEETIALCRMSVDQRVASKVAAPG